MGRLVPIKHRNQRSSGDRAEDRLEADPLGKRRGPDHQQECRAHANLCGGVLKAPQHSREAH
jgi:hypothetical protein